MGSQNLRHAREQFEDELREQVLAAEKALRAAADNYLKVLDQYDDMLDQPDGYRAVQQAASAHREVLERLLASWPCTFVKAK
jgi:hypothetical protein